jgi:phosphonate metabolism-associated iron-containing alcohol dehydrogenase
MIPEWSFHNPTRVICVENAVDRVGELVEAERAVLVTSPGFTERGVVRRVEESMAGKLSGVLDVVTPNPDIDEVDAILGKLRPLEPDLLVALGGGSSIDAAKLLSRSMGSDSASPLSDHYRRGRSLTGKSSIPVVAIPTTAGTGAEVTPTATVWDRKEKKKHSLSGDDLYPLLAVIDPSLTFGLPEDVTISSGLDAISHALESVWNRNASSISIALATQSLRLSLDALPRLKTDAGDQPARTAMMNASLMAGIAISQTKTAISHSISYPLTLDFNVPHGIACSFALPEILRFNAVADDGRLVRLASDLGHGTVGSLEASLSHLLTMLVLPGEHLRKARWLDGHADMNERMLTRERAANNLRAVGPEDLTPIIDAAIARYSGSD